MHFEQLLLLIIIWNLVDMLIVRHLVIKQIKISRGMRPTKEWAELYLQYSWANDFLPLHELDECFPRQPRNENGQMIYVFPADFHGVPMAGGLEKTALHLAIGYWSDYSSCAKVFLYERNRQGTLLISVCYKGNLPQEAPHPPHSLINLPPHWQNLLPE